MLEKLSMAHDSLHRYLFENVSVRGELVQLSDSFQQLTKGKDYPLPVKQLLGELMAATCLLTATIKFEGSITIQIQGDGPVSLLVINGNHKQVMRGTARWKDDFPLSGSLKKLMGNGKIIITIEPEQGERYQGIVGLDGETIEACLEEYFALSEQLKTKLWLRTDVTEENAVAAGLLLQVLPTDTDNTDEFEHLSQLTDTIKNEELFQLDAQKILYLLYHQENVKIYPAKKISFKCTCSRERSSNAIAAIDRQEAEQMLDENGSITLHCDYCGADYEFDHNDFSFIFGQKNKKPDILH